MTKTETELGEGSIELESSQETTGENAEDSVASSDDEILDKIAADVQSVIDREEWLVSAGWDIRQAHLDGQEVQPDVFELFDEVEGLVRLALLDASDKLEFALGNVVEHEKLDVEDRIAFERIWSDLSWIAPAAKAFRQREAGLHGYTDKSLQVSVTESGLVVEHELTNGLDTVHHVEVPYERFFVDAVQRLEVLIRVLPEALEKEAVDMDTLDTLVGEGEDLASIVKMLGRVGRAVEQAHDVEEGSDEESDVTAVKAALNGDDQGEEDGHAGSVERDDASHAHSMFQ